MRSFCIAKASLIFPTKNMCNCYKVIKHLWSGPLDELVKHDALNTWALWFQGDVICKELGAV